MRKKCFELFNKKTLVFLPYLHESLHVFNEKFLRFQRKVSMKIFISPSKVSNDLNENIHIYDKTP